MINHPSHYISINTVLHIIHQNQLELLDDELEDLEDPLLSELEEEEDLLLFTFCFFFSLL